MNSYTMVIFRTFCKTDNFFCDENRSSKEHLGSWIYFIFLAGKVRSWQIGTHLYRFAPNIHPVQNKDPRNIQFGLRGIDFYWCFDNFWRLLYLLLLYLVWKCGNNIWHGNYKSQKSDIWFFYQNFDLFTKIGFYRKFRSFT